MKQQNTPKDAATEAKQPTITKHSHISQALRAGATTVKTKDGIIVRRSPSGIRVSRAPKSDE